MLGFHADSVLTRPAPLILGGQIQLEGGRDLQKHPEHHGTPGCGKEHQGVEGHITLVFPSNGTRDREFTVYLPPTYDKNHPTPVIFSFDCLETDAREQNALSRFKDSTVNSDMIAVFPESFHVSPTLLLLIHAYVSAVLNDSCTTSRGDCFRQSIRLSNRGLSP